VTGGVAAAEDRQMTTIVARIICAYVFGLGRSNRSLSSQKKWLDE
jgi:hypothetical protein